MNNTTLQFRHRFTKCLLPFPIKEVDVKSKILGVIHASLILFIISANLLLIFGDLTLGFVQLPAEIHLLWNPHEPTCFKVHLSKFSMMFPIIMSGTLLCVISVDRYIYVVHNNYYKKIVTKRSPTITIVKRYYSKLFNCGIDKRNLREVAHPNMLLDGETRHATFRLKVSSQKSYR